MAIEVIRTLRLYDESDLDEAVEYLTEAIEGERRSAQKELANRIQEFLATLDTGG
jgi:hypothetical protein